MIFLDLLQEAALLQSFVDINISELLAIFENVDVAANKIPIFQ